MWSRIRAARLPLAVLALATARVARLGDDLLLWWGSPTDGEMSRIAADGGTVPWVWRHQGVLVAMAADGAVLLTGRGAGPSDRSCHRRSVPSRP